MPVGVAAAIWFNFHFRCDSEVLYTRHHDEALERHATPVSEIKLGTNLLFLPFRSRDRSTTVRT